MTVPASHRRQALLSRAEASVSGQSIYVGKHIEVEGDEDSTDLNSGSLRVKGGIAVSKSASIQNLNVMNTLKLPDGHQVNGKVVVNEGPNAKKNVRSNLLQVNGDVSIVGRSVLSNNLLVQGKRWFGGVSLLPSGGMQVFSSTRDAFIDFAIKHNPNKESQDATSLRNYLQMGDASSLQVYNGKIVVNRKGHVGIGVVQPTHILHVDGQIRSSMSTIATASDARLKTAYNACIGGRIIREYFKFKCPRLYLEK